MAEFDILSEKGSGTKHVGPTGPFEHIHPQMRCGALLNMYAIDTPENTAKKTPCKRCITAIRAASLTMQQGIEDNKSAIEWLKSSNVLRRS